jgi:2-oxoisovalerate dehydrogenase E1 component
MYQHPPLQSGRLDDPNFLHHLLYHLLLTRAVEERSVKEAKQGRQPKFFSAWGNEATAVGTAAALDRDDVLVPMHRSLGAHLIRGHSLREVFLQAFLKEESQTRGRDTGLHLGADGGNIIGMISPLGSMNPVAAGVAWTERYLGRDTVTLAYIGDGGTSLGVFHEAMNWIGVQKLPVVTVIENNQWAYGTPNDREFACETLASRGPAYGMPGVRVDGTDLAAVYKVTKDAVDRARAGGGPTLIESVTMRMRGHAEHDNQHYVPKALLEEWAKRDPVDTFIRWLGERRLLLDVDIPALRKELDALVLDAADLAFAAPEPVREGAFVGVFAGDGGERAVPQNGSQVSRAPSIEAVRDAAGRRARAQRREDRRVAVIEPGETASYLDTIRQCLRYRLETDPTVVVLGEDVGLMGGAFGVTLGFQDEFGPDRVMDMPIAEGAISGGSIGMAIRGLKPVSEMQFSDFVASCFNELVNNAGTFRYRIGVPVPMVMRLPAGGGVGAGPFHSLMPEAWFAHSPGIKVVCPSTIEDAWGLLNAAIDDPDPVLYLEQKYYYRRVKGPLPAREHRVPLGVARIARPGKDATVVSWGVTLERCLLAAEALAKDGKGDVEVIDLRSIIPWDQEAVAASVRKTSRLLIVHEARRTGGFGGEIAAWAGERLFEWLDAPVRRLASADVPSPSHKDLEKATSPQAEDVARALGALLAY